MTLGMPKHLRKPRTNFKYSYNSNVPLSFASFNYCKFSEVGIIQGLYVLEHIKNIPKTQEGS